MFFVEKMLLLELFPGGERGWGGGGAEGVYIDVHV